MLSYVSYQLFVHFGFSRKVLGLILPSWPGKHDLRLWPKPCSCASLESNSTYMILNIAVGIPSGKELLKHS